MRILLVLPYVPSAIRTRSYGFLRALRRLGHAVHLVALQPPEDRWAPTDVLTGECETLEIFPLSRIRTLWNGLRALPGPWPLQAAYGVHPTARHRVQQLADTGGFDVLHVEHLRGARLAQGVTGIPIVFDAVDAISLLLDAASRNGPGRVVRSMARWDLARTRRFESRLPDWCTRIIVTSPRDRDALVAAAGDRAASRIAVVSNGVVPGPVANETPESGRTVIFTGKMSYHANVAAAHFLSTEIMPRIWRLRPDVRLVLAGKDPPPLLRRLARDPRVSVTGFVGDLRHLLARATVALTPLPYGVGVQNKVLEAMASGVPVVASRGVARGIAAVDGEHWLVADTPEDLAASAIRVIDDPVLRARLGAAGRRYVEDHHQWDACARRLVCEYRRAQADYAAAVRS